MKFSTKSRYALRLMAELARYAPGTTVSLKEISERQNLSLKYLEQIVTPLARVGLVKSERGSQGGYRLTKAPADYTAASSMPFPTKPACAGSCPLPPPEMRVTLLRLISFFLTTLNFSTNSSSGCAAARPWHISYTKVSGVFIIFFISLSPRFVRD